MTYTYEGMVDAKNKPHGFGRAIETKGSCMYEGQFKDGNLHGFIRNINNNAENCE